MRKSHIVFSALFALIVILSPTLSLAEPQIFSRAGKAIAGYDPVAYFTDKMPVAGKASFTYKWRKADWYFSSAVNRDLFSANPEKYAPQYGGYCAYAMAYNANASINPAAWNVVNDKLYLNYSTYVKGQWQGQQSSYISKADENWKIRSFD